MLGCVDDKRHYTNLLRQTIKESISEAMTKSVNTWEELLTFVGGKLELTKCSYYLLELECDKKEKSTIKTTSEPIYFVEIERKKVASTLLQPNDDNAYLALISQPTLGAEFSRNSVIW